MNPAVPQGLGLTDVATARLERLLRALHRGDIAAPLQPVPLALAGLQDDANALLAALRGLDTAAVRAVLVCVLAERRAAAG
jgi:hypothetical protein